jgi:hypothetical protein
MPDEKGGDGVWGLDAEYENEGTTVGMERRYPTLASLLWTGFSCLTSYPPNHARNLAVTSTK